MKKSEMLSKIASVIINYNEAHCVINRDKAMEMASTILVVQEELGMLPPGREEFMATGLPDEYGNEMLHSIFINEWDNE